MATQAKTNWTDRKLNLKRLIIQTFSETGYYVDYAFLRQTIEPKHRVLISLLKCIALDDFRMGLPTTDSLVLKWGQLLPPIEHFAFRIRKEMMSVNEEPHLYHNRMIQRWCTELHVDFDKLNNTVPPRSTVQRKKKSSIKIRPAAKRNTPTYSRGILHALNSKPGTFSINAMIKMEASKRGHA